MRAVTVLLTVGLVATGLALTSVFHVDPRTAAWSGWTELGLYNYVSEVLTLNVDSLGPPGYCELFSGADGAQRYYLSVRTFPGNFEVAHGDTVEARGHVWVRCTLEVVYPESLVKGRRYEFRWSRDNGARILYYYDYCATKFDSMIVPGEDQPPPGPIRPALAMRCYGVMDRLDSLLCGMDAGFPVQEPAAG